MALLLEVAKLALILLKAPFYQLRRAASLFYWPQKDLANEIVFLTGGASGIGKGMAIKLAELGARIIICDLNERAAQACAEGINRSGLAGRAWGFGCDVSDRDAVYALADKVRGEIGEVTMLINNAGIVSGKKLLEADDALMEKVVQVNTIAHFWTLKAFLPSMLAKNHGHIVNIASSAGKFGVAGLVDYCASKYGAVGTHEALRADLRKLNATGVHTTVICPYFIDTGMFDGAQTRYPWFLPILKPDYVVDKIIFAIRTNQACILMPRFLILADLLRAVFPPETQEEVAEWFGVNEAMDDFRGRAKQD
ncbi:uncharacterized protein MONBRDRAFT_32991 [Monosiga brevicollis MX1]|uniref:Short-chain dehydrogenase/reductase 3 n=1 Tax=Monosiga brevicollis TaxID=81824 RepID=A9V2X0_MONBE|nr:uncharacterized protein MONBRDRAFT_32991 [Monosiga brevicollis MX1]EDQ87958.1 predicted protein [Monosiga brevicollis MX1]|eukprot:XP_001747034.1 hypothetical protein [Monosiga brevicollis MX1]